MTEFTKRIVRDNYIYTGCYTNCLQSSIPPCDTGRTRRMGRWGAGEQKCKTWREETVRGEGSSRGRRRSGEKVFERFRKRIRNRRTSIDGWRELERKRGTRNKDESKKEKEKKEILRSTNFLINEHRPQASSSSARRKLRMDGDCFKGTRKRRLEESFQYEINPWTTMEEERKVFFSASRRSLEETCGDLFPFLPKLEGRVALFLSDPRSTLDSLFHRSFLYI